MLPVVIALVILGLVTVPTAVAALPVPEAPDVAHAGKVVCFHVEPGPPPVVTVSSCSS